VWVWSLDAEAFGYTGTLQVARWYWHEEPYQAGGFDWRKKSKWVTCPKCGKEAENPPYKPFCLGCGEGWPPELRRI